MSLNGRIVFQGRVEKAVGVFEKAGMPCPVLYNPAEFYVKMVSQGRNDERLNRVSQICEEKLKGKETERSSEIPNKRFSSNNSR